MDRVMSNLGCTDCNIKPEFLILYGIVAVLLTVVINWILATILFMLKPFTCAAILFAFIRPDIVQKFIQEDILRFMGFRFKQFMSKLIYYLANVGDHYSHHR